MSYENPENIIRSWNVQTNFATGPVTAAVGPAAVLSDQDPIPPHLAGGIMQLHIGLGKQQLLHLPAGVPPRGQRYVPSHKAAGPGELDLQEVPGSVRDQDYSSSVPRTRGL